MHNTNQILVTLILWMMMGVSSAWAQAPDISSGAPSNTMTPQEYEVYRAQLQQQIEQANLPSQNNMTESKAEKPSMQDATEKSGGGYGQGYRARAERNDSAARMNARGSGMMHRGGGRGH
ncbi:MAG: hypothetical protein C0406_03575 [Sideroxydans sp.]|nr:hypothetical protein [Sideroxydans sp.]